MQKVLNWYFKFSKIVTFKILIYAKYNKFSHSQKNSNNPNVKNILFRIVILSQFIYFCKLVDKLPKLTKCEHFAANLNLGVGTES